MVSSTPRHPASINSPTRCVRWILTSVLAFGALNAFGGGCYGLGGARGIPTHWLAHSPFRDYFVPSFVLFVVVGGSLLLAAAGVFFRATWARGAALGAGAILLGWIAVQVAIIGYVSWMQPTTAAAGLGILALASFLPSVAAPRGQAGTRTFFSYYLGALRRPRQTFEALIADPRRVQLGALALLTNAALYTLVYLFLVMGNGRPTTFKPWLAIDAESYYRYDAFLLAPSMFMAWIVATGVAQLLGKLFDASSGSFEDTLSTLGFSIAIASWMTLLHDLLTSALGAFGFIDQRRYEDAMNAPTPFRTLIWALMSAYLVAFLVLFTKAIGAAHRVRTGTAVVLAGCAFAAYQAVFLLFNR